MKLRRVVPVVAAVFCAIAAISLVRELVALGPSRIVSMLGHQRPGVMVGALALVVVNYFVLTCQDQLAFAYVGRRLARWRIGLASFVGYAISNSVAAGGLSGAAVRYRFYERWDIDPADLARIVLFYSATFWLGLLVLGGASLAFAPPTNLGEVIPHSAAHVAGWILMGTAAGYVVACGLRRAPVRLGGVELAVPSVDEAP